MYPGVRGVITSAPTGELPQRLHTSHTPTNYSESFYLITSTATSRINDMEKRFAAFTRLRTETR